MKTATGKGLLLIGSISSLLVLSVPAAAQDVTPTGTRGNRFGERIPTVQQRFTDKITRFQGRIDEKKQKLTERIKQRVLQIIKRFRNVIERLRRHLAKIRELATRLATERGVSIASVESLLSFADGEINSAESKLNELEAAANAIDPSTTPPTSAIDSLYGKFKDVHQDLMDARKFLYDAIRTLNELRVNTRPTRTPRVTILPASPELQRGEPTAVPTVSP